MEKRALTPRNQNRNGISKNNKLKIKVVAIYLTVRFFDATLTSTITLCL